MIVVGERRHGGAEEGEGRKRKEGRPLMKKKKTPKEIKERKTKETEIERRERDSRVKRSCSGRV